MVGKEGGFHERSRTRNEAISDFKLADEVFALDITKVGRCSISAP